VPNLKPVFPPIPSDNLFPGIAVYRKRMNLSQSKFARLLNVATATVGFWETGRSYPFLPEVYRIADVLGCYPQDLLKPKERKMIAFHGNPAIKQEYQDRLKAHHAADQIIKGAYWEPDQFTGCAVGCTLHKGGGCIHKQYEIVLGIPRTLAYLEDRIFENLPAPHCADFAVNFLDAIPVGGDLSLVTARFMVWLLADESGGVLRFTVGFPEAAAAVQGVAVLYSRMIAGEVIPKESWETAAAAAACAVRAATDVAYAAYAADVLDAADVPDAADVLDAAACAVRAASDVLDAAAYAARAAADAAANAAADAAAYAATDAADVPDAAAYAAAYAARAATDATYAATYAADVLDAAAYAAAYAARAATDAAYAAYAADVLDAAAYAAAYAARAAAYAADVLDAAADAAAYAARAAAFQKMAAKLLELLAAAPTPAKGVE
jgi:transcriptional regulator with XRE-family HTH domain